MKALKNTIGLVALLAAGITFNANALLLTPTTATWQGSVPKNPDANDLETITGTSAQLELAYKANVGGSEEGSFADSYRMTSSSDPSDAEIRYGSGPAITGTPIYLVVKDGDNNPIWYVFNISTWNGTERIDLRDFWPNQGAISYVAIYNGSGSTSVPDAGSTLALLGAALTGVGFLRRKLGSA